MPEVPYVPLYNPNQLLPCALVVKSPVAELRLENFHHIPPVCVVQFVLPRRVPELFVEVLRMHIRRASRGVQLETSHCTGDIIFIK